MRGLEVKEYKISEGLSLVERTTSIEEPATCQWPEGLGCPKWGLGSSGGDSGEMGDGGATPSASKASAESACKVDSSQMASLVRARQQGELDIWMEICQK